MQMIRSHSATPPSRSLGPSGGRWPGGATRCILFPPSKPWSGSRIGNGSRASGDVRERGLHGQECAAPAGPARPQPATSSGSAGQGPGLSRPGPSRESRCGAQRRRELPRGRVRPRMGILFTRIWRLFNHQGEGLGWGAGSSPGPGGGGARSRRPGAPLWLCRLRALFTCHARRPKPGQVLRGTQRACGLISTPPAVGAGQAGRGEPGRPEARFPVEVLRRAGLKSEQQALSCLRCDSEAFVRSRGGHSSYCSWSEKCPKAALGRSVFG